MFGFLQDGLVGALCSYILAPASGMGHIQDPYRGEISPTKAAWPRSSIEIVFSFDIPDVWRAMYKSLSSFTIT
ncbi:hypothetical protein EV421DRAFT_1854639 [Armillaria borealis]|uniref:Uncharacterized protein n=1 Tax=Armillaria borealis TaxID=47425 RepID=A0AA39MDW9_9AGAR|nr:hypothetical protein EV421DRAFT_1854639 [Armillaria borealis]